MSDKKKSRAHLEAENELLRRACTSKNATKVVLALIMWGALVLIVNMFSGIVDSLAGKTTEADIKIDTNVKAEGALTLNKPREESKSRDYGSFCVYLASLGLVFGFGGIGLARSQAKLRKDTVESLQEKIRRYEAHEDPGRSTSKLTKRGETRPEDR